ncbi:MAG: hypothetical protein RR811_15920, partial [Comamonas sp.]
PPPPGPRESHMGHKVCKLTLSQSLRTGFRPQISDFDRPQTLTIVAFNSKPTLIKPALAAINSST